jgi:hypothetical protein
MQANQIWFPHCFITEVAQAVADLERGRPQRDPGNVIVASPTEAQRTSGSSFGAHLDGLSRRPRADLTLLDGRGILIKPNGL